MAFFDFCILYYLYPFVGLEERLSFSFAKCNVFLFGSEGIKRVFESGDELKYTLSRSLATLAQVLNAWSMKATEIFPKRLQRLIVRHSA
jgi:hypothetical protein